MTQLKDHIGQLQPVFGAGFCRKSSLQQQKAGRHAGLDRGGEVVERD